MKTLILCLLLAGCAAPVTTLKSVNGIQYIEHLDAPDSPCGFRDPSAGCHAKSLAGISEVWYSSISPAYVYRHELAHVQGMQHTPWAKDMFGRNCATVLVGHGWYEAGRTICVTHTGESIL